MRLSDEKARRLWALVWRERLRRWLPVVAALVALAGAITYFNINQLARVDRTIDVQQRDGRVTGHKSGGSSPSASILYVHLEDGRDVEAFSTFRVAPPNGSHVIVSEARHASGRTTYDVVRLFDQ